MLQTMEKNKRSFVREAESKFALLFQVSRTIVSNRYLADILNVVVRLTAELMGSKICSLLLLDETKGQLVIEATQSLSEDYLAKPPVKVEHSVSGRAVKLKKPVAVRDVTREVGYSYPEIAEKVGLASMIAVPMMIKGRVIGVLNCYTADPYEFTDEEMQVLMGVANQAALAIENRNLFFEKKQALEDLETRKFVERAKGILMKRHRLDEPEAYRLLQKAEVRNGYLFK